MSTLAERNRGQPRLAALVFCVVGGLATSALAQTANAPQADDDSTGLCPGFSTGLMQRGNLLGPICGLRPFLASYGISFSLQEISEAMGNVSGGIRLGATYDGLTTMTLQLDTSKLNTAQGFGWEGGLLNASALQIHGRSLSQNYLDNLQTASGIEADRATRLWELWYQQSFLDGRVDVKLGQQSLDQEFIVSSNAALFVNTMFGWPMLPSADLPSGGPGLSAVLARLTAQGPANRLPHAAMGRLRR